MTITLHTENNSSKEIVIHTKVGDWSFPLCSVIYADSISSFDSEQIFIWIMSDKFKYLDGYSGLLIIVDEDFINKNIVSFINTIKQLTTSYIYITDKKHIYSENKPLAHLSLEDTHIVERISESEDHRWKR